MSERQGLLRELADMDKLQALDYAQKAKVVWSVEGDENSAFFHGMLKKRRYQMTVRGISLGGEWVTEPPVVKKAFYDFYAAKFQPFHGVRINQRSEGFRSIRTDVASNLEIPFSVEEIKAAVWDCGGDKAPGPDGFSFKFLKHYWDILGTDIVGGDKAPGPDGFSFKFLKHYWDILGTDIVAFVREFHSRPSIPVGCNSSFITLIPKVDSPLVIKDYRPISLIGVQLKIITKLLANRIVPVLNEVIGVEQSAFLKGRQILDGPLMVSELVSWYRKKKKKLLIFKVDFEKAYDTLSWDYLDQILQFLGFGERWRSWVRGIFTNARSSVLVNGSATDEFQLHRGLRQGDPLSPFLFIIAMEGLHVAMEDAVLQGAFRGVRLGVGDGELMLSHLFYADDALFVGEWDEANVQNLICILHCFYLTSGLRINLLKSNVYGVGVTDLDIHTLAAFTGCSA